MAWSTDVFVCYGRPAAGADGFDLGQWSAKLIATLKECVNPNSFNDIPRVVLSPDPTSADAALAEVDKSALLLVLLSPALLAEPGRLAEIARFRDQAAHDGRTVAQTVLVMVEATPVETALYPEIDWLRGAGALTSAGQGFTTPDGKPLEADRAGPGQPFVALIPAIQSLAGDIRRKLAGLSVKPLISSPPKPEASLSSTSMTGPAPLRAKPRRALVYLEAASSEQFWNDTRDHLDEEVNINPASWAAPTSDLKVRIQRKQDRRAFLLECKGQILIRADPSDQTGLQLVEAEAARNEIIDAGEPAPAWVLVDWVRDDGPILPGWAELPRVSTEEDDWPAKVREKLGL